MRPVTPDMTDLSLPVSSMIPVNISFLHLSGIYVLRLSILQYVIRDQNQSSQRRRTRICAILGLST